MAFSTLSNNEVAVLYATTRDNDAMEEAMRRYHLLVYSYAERYRERADYEDIVQEGKLALVQALNGYRPEKGEFSTIAVHYISGKVRHYLRDRAHTVRHPSRVQDHYRREMLARAALEASFGREPTVDEVADALGMDVDALERFWRENPSRLWCTDLSAYTTNDATGRTQDRPTPRTMMASLTGTAIDMPSLLDDEERAMLVNSTVTEIARAYSIPMIDARRVKDYASMSHQ